MNDVGEDTCESSLGVAGMESRFQMCCIYLVSICHPSFQVCQILYQGHECDPTTWVHFSTRCFFRLKSFSKTSPIYERVP